MRLVEFVTLEGGGPHEVLLDGTLGVGNGLVVLAILFTLRILLWSLLVIYIKV